MPENESPSARARRLARRKEYYEKNKERILAHQKARRQLDPEAARLRSLEQGRRWRAENPGRTTQMTRQKRGVVGAPAETPDGNCQICSRYCEPLRCDHDKRTGRVRGWLCNRCNLGLGQLGDTLECIERVRAYLIAALLEPSNDVHASPPAPDADTLALGPPPRSRVSAG